MKQDVIKVLQELNFTEYEAKAYLALLEKSPLSGYAVSLNSGVPRSKIYEVLGGLTDRGEVIVCHENPALYSPLPPGELIAQRKRRAEESLGRAEKLLEQYPQTMQNREYIWNITGYEAIFDRAGELIKRAGSRIMIEIWREDADILKEQLKAASENGVEVLALSYGDPGFDFGQVYLHDKSDEITDACGGRWITVCIDDREVVAGIVSLGDDSRAAWTMHPSLVKPITQATVHELYIMEILKEYRDVLEVKFGPGLMKLRRRFNRALSGGGVAFEPETDK